MLQQDTGPKIVPVGRSIAARVCIWTAIAPDVEVAPLHDSLCHDLTSVSIGRML